MKKLFLLAATLVLSTGVMLGQTSPAATDTGWPNAAPDRTQRDTHSTSPITDHAGRQTAPNPDRTGATPDTALPSTTIDDQQPGNSTTGSPSSTMGTTGSTPGTDQNTGGNQSGNTPHDTQQQKGDNTQQPKPESTEPHDKYPSGSSNPGSSANGANSSDMSGSNPKAEDSTTSPNPPTTTTPHMATHVPDPGTETNPAAIEVPASQPAPSKRTSSYLPLTGAMGMFSLA